MLDDDNCSYFDGLTVCTGPPKMLDDETPTPPPNYPDTTGLP
jgi:hypothetical protein